MTGIHSFCSAGFLSEPTCAAQADHGIVAGAHGVPGIALVAPGELMFSHTFTPTILAAGPLGDKACRACMSGQQFFPVGKSLNTSGSGLGLRGQEFEYFWFTSHGQLNSGSALSLAALRRTSEGPEDVPVLSLAFSAKLLGCPH